MTLWAGRVDSELAPEVWELVKAADAELFPYDVEGTRLHARRLAVAGILEPEELAPLADASVKAGILTEEPVLDEVVWVADN